MADRRKICRNGFKDSAVQFNWFFRVARNGPKLLENLAEETGVCGIGFVSPRKQAL